jgi:predicted nucleic acid-binding protein
VAARVTSAFKGRKLVVDNSAFQRGGNEIVRADWIQALKEGHLYRSPILEFEVLYSARNAREHAELREELREELEALRPLELSEAVVGAALEAQAKLARHAAGFHRLPHQDYLVAAIAAAHELGVLHYDADFDRIAEHSSLAFESVWIASAGTFDKEATATGASPSPAHYQFRVLSEAEADFLFATGVSNMVGVFEGHE